MDTSVNQTLKPTWTPTGKMVTIKDSQGNIRELDEGAWGAGAFQQAGYTKVETPKPIAPVTPVEEPSKTPVDTATDNSNKALSNLEAIYDKQYANIMSNLDNLTSDISKIDAETNPVIQDIKNTFERRKNEMAVTNQAMVEQTNLSNVRTNLQRYAPQMAEGLVSAEVTNGMNRLSELESQKIQAVQKAKEALTSQAKDKWKTFNEFMTQASDAYKNKVQTVLDIQKNLRQSELDAQTKMKADIEIQTDKAEALASGLVDVDEDGNIIEPTGDELTKYADDRGIEPDFLIQAVNERIDALKKVERENRGKTSYYDEKGAGNKTIRHYFNENTGEELYTKNLGQTYKGSSGGGSGSGSNLTAEEKKFQTDLAKNIEDLSTGKKDWGQVYKYMAVQYGKSNPQLTQQLTEQQKQELGAGEGEETYLDVLLGKNYFRE